MYGGGGGLEGVYLGGGWGLTLPGLRIVTLIMILMRPLMVKVEGVKVVQLYSGD